MPVKLGNNNLTFSGISEIYVGSNKVYSATPPGPPIIDNPVNEYFCVYSAKSFTISFEKVQTASGASGNLNYNNLKLKYSTNKTTWTEVSAAQGFNFNGGTLYYIYTSSADVGTTSSSTDLGLQSASWGQVCSAPAYGYYSYTSTRMNFSGTSTIYLMGNIRTIAQGDQATPYNSYVGSKTKIDYVRRSVSTSDYYIYYSRACGLGASTYQHSSSPYSLIARGIFNLRGTSNSIIDINNLFIGEHEESSYPTFTYSTGTPYTPTSTLDKVPFYIDNPGTSAITVPFVRVMASNSKTNLIEIRPSTTAWTGGVKYSTDMTTWTTTTSTNISIPANTRMFFAAENPATDTQCQNSYYNNSFFSSLVYCRMINLDTKTCKVGGNILSLYYGTNFTNKTMSSTLSYQKSWTTPYTWTYNPSTTADVGYGIPMAYSSGANFGGLLVGYGYFYASSMRCYLNQGTSNVDYSNLYLPFAASTSLPSYTTSSNNMTGMYHNSNFTTLTNREPIVEISSTTPAKIVGYMGYTLSLVIRGSNTIAASQVVNTSGYFYSQKSSARPITIHMLPGQSITGLSSYSYISVVNDLDLTISL